MGKRKLAKTLQEIVTSCPAFKKKKACQDVVSGKPLFVCSNAHQGATHNVIVMSDATTNMHNSLSFVLDLFCRCKYKSFFDRLFKNCQLFSKKHAFLSILAYFCQKYEDYVITCRLFRHTTHQLVPIRKDNDRYFSIYPQIEKSLQI